MTERRGITLRRFINTIAPQALENPLQVGEGEEEGARYTFPRQWSARVDCPSSRTLRPPVRTT